MLHRHISMLIGLLGCGLSDRHATRSGHLRHALLSELVAGRTVSTGTTLTTVAVTGALFTRLAVVAIAVAVAVARFHALSGRCGCSLRVFWYEHYLLRLAFALSILAFGAGAAFATTSTSTTATSATAFAAWTFHAFGHFGTIAVTAFLTFGATAFAF